MDEKSKKHKRRYLSYLLRLWQENGGDHSPGESPLWRASLERPQTGNRLGFASLVNLFAYLEDETGSNPLVSRQSEEENTRPTTLQDDSTRR